MEFCFLLILYDKSLYSPAWILKHIPLECTTEIMLVPYYVLIQVTNQILTECF